VETEESEKGPAERYSEAMKKRELMRDLGTLIDADLKQLAIAEKENDDVSIEAYRDSIAEKTKRLEKLRRESRG